MYMPPVREESGSSRPMGNISARSNRARLPPIVIGAMTERVCTSLRQPGFIVSNSPHGGRRLYTNRMETTSMKRRTYLRTMLAGASGVALTRAAAATQPIQLHVDLGGGR